jgi:hypothetical protein
LNSYFSWWEELTAVSPIWGIGLCIAAIILGVLSANTAKELVEYVCGAAIIAALALAGGFFAVRGNRFDTAPPAQKIAQLMLENRAVAFYGDKYHGHFQFMGRLHQPIALITESDALTKFANQHPTGYILVKYKDSKELPESWLSEHYPFKSHFIGFISCKTLIGNPGISVRLPRH